MGFFGAIKGLGKMVGRRFIRTAIAGSATLAATNAVIDSTVPADSEIFGIPMNALVKVVAFAAGAAVEKGARQSIRNAVKKPDFGWRDVPRIKRIIDENR